MSTERQLTLFTANEDVASSFLKEAGEISDMKLLHLSLEHYSYAINKDEEKLIREKLPSFSFIIHGNLRNARFFTKWANEAELLPQVQNIVHIVPNQSTVDFLAKYDIPAIMPREDARPIDVIEFMLRISREGTVLYPTTDQQDEEIPGLLQELEMPVVEFSVCREKTLPSETLNEYRDQVKKQDVDSVIFHSRSSVNRIQIAFPDLDFSELTCISSGQAVTQKLQESGIEPDQEAKGSWRSLLELLKS